MRLKKGILIVIEGIDGSGKTTQAQILLDKLLGEGYDAVYFQEPSDSRWGKKIREKAAFQGSLSPEQELELFQRDRRENVEKNLKPALKKKRVVILDRYYFSTIAYQGVKGINPERIRVMNEEFVIKPDLVFILDIEAGKGLGRVEESRKKKDLLFEREEFLAEVRKAFRSFVGGNIFHLDGENSRDHIGKRIEEIVLDYIEPFKS